MLSYFVNIELAWLPEKQMGGVVQLVMVDAFLLKKQRTVSYIHAEK